LQRVHCTYPLLCCCNSQDVVEKCHLSGDFFCAYLHQNYLDFFNTIEDVVSASEYLSDADYLTIDWAVSCTLEANGLLGLETHRLLGLETHRLLGLETHRLLGLELHRLLGLETHRLLGLETHRLLGLETHRLLGVETHRLLGVETHRLLGVETH